MIKNKNNLIVVIGFIIGIIISATGVYAATIIGKGSDLTYSNTSSGLSSANIQDSLDELYKYKENLNCPEGKVCVKNNLKLGDYVKMTPTKSSYTTDTSKTGYTKNQTINPQELNLWRVISLNDDGTVDVVSEHVSSTAIYFEGQTGYLNLVGYLNELAKQYENSTYTKGSRHFGYNGQTEYITDISKFTTDPPWECSTGESCNPIENQGGGDKLYTKDYNLVKDVLGSVVANKQNGSASSYLLASRYYAFFSSRVYYWEVQFINTNGDVEVSDSYLYAYLRSDFDYYFICGSLRPILTLKSGLNYSGSGTETNPYVLSES